MQITIYQVDAFTQVPFGGNPAGVVPDARGISDEYMQKIAKEMNLSETAFVIPIDNKNYKVRFFTPVEEVDLCGHATIATFYTLASKGYLTSLEKGIERVYQETKAGRLQVDIFFENNRVTKVMMEQAKPKDLGEVLDIESLLKCFNLNREDIGIENEYVVPKIVSTGLADIMLPVNRKEKLYNLKFDTNRLIEISKKLNVVGVHAFYLPKYNSDIVYTRNFAPLVGINEEAATGTSNGALIYFLKKHGYLKGNELISIQGESMNRPSRINCFIEEKDGSYRVKVGGEARIIMEAIMSF
ncbi:MAG: PhzF family phenazine biosynthesis protein [Tissierellia bacterium]|nr:PhzF family phenazine biosynthesis protein [Tissierellia bacterium]